MDSIKANEDGAYRCNVCDHIKGNVFEYGMLECQCVCHNSAITHWKDYYWDDSVLGTAGVDLDETSVTLDEDALRQQGRSIETTESEKATEIKEEYSEYAYKQWLNDVFLDENGELLVHGRHFRGADDLEENDNPIPNQRRCINIEEIWMEYSKKTKIF